MCRKIYRVVKKVTKNVTLGLAASVRGDTVWSIHAPDSRSEKTKQNKTNNLGVYAWPMGPHPYSMSGT
mgnify:CR=1 FL=1